MTARTVGKPTPAFINKTRLSLKNLPISCLYHNALSVIHRYSFLLFLPVSLVDLFNSTIECYNVFLRIAEIGKGKIRKSSLKHDLWGHELFGAAYHISALQFITIAKVQLRSNKKIIL